MIVKVIPPITDPMSEPNDTNRVMAIMGTDIIKHSIPQIGDKTIRAAHPDAIPLPPLKLLKTGHMCPYIEANPIIE